MTVDARDPVYVDTDGTVVYRASALGMCLRALVAARQGCPPCPPGAKQAADQQAGIDYETVVLHKLTRMGFEISHQQREYDLPVSEGVIVRCHVDGLVTRVENDGASTSVLEVKSVAPSTFKLWQRKRFDAFPGWGYQLGVAMLASNLPGLMVVANRQTGVLHCHVVESASYPYLLMIQERIRTAGTYLDNQDEAPCPATFPCLYFYLHDSNISGEGPVLTPEATPEHIRVVLREARQNASGAILERVEERLREVGEL